MKKLTIIFTLIIFLLFQKNAAFAQENILFQDNFEAGLDKWDVNNGNINDFTIINGRLEAKIENRSRVSEIVPKNDFWVNAENIEFTFSYLGLRGEDKNFSFNVRDKSNWYEFHFNNGGLEVAKVVNGSVTWRKNSGHKLANNILYQIKILLINNTFELYVDNNLYFKDFDPTFADDYGKIGIKVGTGANYPTHVVFDNITVRDLSKETFPHYYQSDPSWADQEYDSAATWSPENSTIERWGCALTSLAMIFHAHDITTFADNSTITPSTLNSWLLDQADGYIGDGLVNFAAVMRLTRELHESNGTTKLEYGRGSESNTDLALSEIEADRPTILQIPGHFLVAYDKTQDNSDLLIKDPAYTYSRFSEHQQQVVSTRTFTPSNTDLSYILVTHSPDSNIVLSAPNGSPLPTYTEYITSAHSNDSSPEVAITEIPKPSSGKYSLSIQSDSTTPYSFEVYTYDVEGVPTIHSKSGVTGLHPTTFLLDYQKEAPSSLTPVTPPISILQNLSNLFDQKHIHNRSAYNALQQVLARMQSAWPEKEQKFVEQSKHLIEGLSTEISPEEKEMLLQQIEHQYEE